MGVPLRHHSTTGVQRLDDRSDSRANCPELSLSQPGRRLLKYCLLPFTSPGNGVYLEQQEVAADNLQGQLESNPDYQAEIAELRSRILGRWTTVQENGEAKPPA